MVDCVYVIERGADFESEVGEVFVTLQGAVKHIKESAEATGAMVQLNTAEGYFTIDGPSGHRFYATIHERRINP